MWDWLGSEAFDEMLFSITQSVIALIVVIGGGLMLLLTDIDPVIVTGLMGVVVGYYFGRHSGTSNGYRQAVKALKKE